MWTIRRRKIGSAHAWVVWRPGYLQPAYVTGGRFDEVLGYCRFVEQFDPEMYRSDA